MKKYMTIYQYYTDAIQNEQLKNGERLPSLRKAAALFSCSITTVQNAYFALQADGYILASEKRGYFVSERHTTSPTHQTATVQPNGIRYDLSSGGADKHSFDISLWQRYIKNALRQQERLLTYSEVQGEPDLREALAHYIREKRNVITAPERIVIGAGVLNLLGVLCALVKDRRTVSFPNESFRQGISLFQHYGYEVHTRDKNADIIYVSPSHMSAYGEVMPVTRRAELVRHSRQRGSLIIEDDYDSDFLYNAKPTPSLHALAGGGNIIYMGSFSNVLTPAIRISFMVLPEELATRYRAQAYQFAQAAGKTEQIALCQYIRDGHIQKQTRKIRRLYTAKAKTFLEALQKRLPDGNCIMSENGLQIMLTHSFNGNPNAFREAGISVHIQEYQNRCLRLVISPSALPAEEIENAAAALAAILTTA